MLSSPGAKFVDKYRSELIQKVHMVMPVMEELLLQGLLDEETRLKIITSKSDEEKMIELYKAMDAGGDKVKYAFYSELKDYEPHLVNDLGKDRYFSQKFLHSKFLTHKKKTYLTKRSQKKLAKAMVGNELNAWFRVVGKGSFLCLYSTYGNLEKNGLLWKHIKGVFCCRKPSNASSP